MIYILVTIDDGKYETYNFYDINNYLRARYDVEDMGFIFVDSRMARDNRSNVAMMSVYKKVKK